jgi:hypothetical protein
MVWRDKCDVYILTNVHNPPTEGNFGVKQGKTLKPLTAQECNQHWNIWIKVTE